MCPPVSGPGAPTPCDPSSHDTPAAVQPGSRDYYQQRLEDFERRNPGVSPPDYYLGYGHKYMERFASLDASDLSPRGLEWRDRTMQALQQKIEDLRISDPEKFAELERDPEAFRAFAFGTHPAAYVESGLYDLPVQDLLVIAATPDIGDVLSSEGILQTLITLGKITPQDALDILANTMQRAVEDGGYGGPPLAALKVVARLVERLAAQDAPPLPPIDPGALIDRLRDLPVGTPPTIPVPGLPKDFPGIELPQLPGGLPSIPNFPRFY